MFRRVAPGGGYRVAGKRVRVLPNRSAPPSTKGYAQRIPTSGYGYLTHPRRDDARDRRPAAERPGPVPHAGRVLRLRLRRPGRRGELDQPDRQPARLRGRRREHARDRLQRRRVRLLRAAAGPRRLRRGRDRRAAALGQGEARHGRGELRRHQPAVRRRHEAAEPRRDRAALGDRQHGDDALPGRDPQHRLRAELGEGPRPRRQAGERDRRPAVGAQADPRGRQDLQGEPGAPPRGGRPAREDRAQPLLRAGGRRSAGAGHVRPQDPRPDVPRLPVDRRADRRPLPDAREPVHRHRAASGSRSRTGPTSTRSTPRRSTAGSTSSSCTSPAARRGSRPGPPPSRR